MFQLLKEAQDLHTSMAIRVKQWKVEATH
eukprot:COSAG02_NODE_43757_length_372_cov_0.560440_1_plen_28_part_10